MAKRNPPTRAADENASPSAHAESSEATTGRPRRVSLLNVALFVLAVGLLGGIDSWFFYNGVAAQLAKNAEADQPDKQRGFATGSDPIDPDAAGNSSEKRDKPHPLDPALVIARDGLKHIQDNVDDFTATIFKRERVDGKLVEEEMFCKVRCRKVKDGEVVVPLSAYLKFTAPKARAGREVIWVEGRDDGKLIAHEPGLLNLVRFHLHPENKLAMIGNRYPITRIGIENLVAALIFKAERDRAHDECEVKIVDGAKVNGRVCKMIQIVHPHPREHFDFHIARVFVDDELNIPIHYAAHSWPAVPGGKPVLEEEYTYTNVKLNVGLTDEDFNPDNPAYNYP